MQSLNTLVQISQLNGQPGHIIILFLVASTVASPLQ